MDSLTFYHRIGFIARSLTMLCVTFLSVTVMPAAKRTDAVVEKVTLDDAFWSSKMKVWNDVTIPDVLRKFEGKHTSDPSAHNAFDNFRKVAGGERGTHTHFGEPWFDGLIYETIRGVADYLRMFPDSALEERIDGYIESIAKAQATEPSGYIETYTQLEEPDHRWGENGGFLRWQHDVYNAGMMVEAAVHYYRATGKTRLLEVAVRFANLMASEFGVEPKKNVVPSHSGPEEAMVKLYRLFRDEPELKKRMPVNVNEKDYLDLVTFWIETRGSHCGYPHWLEWGNPKSEKWIRDNRYAAPEFGAWSRPGWGDYAQDSISVFSQQTIEGHAVRATLLGTGIATLALENHDARYIDAARRLWDNMVGRRMFITGGVGAIHEDEKFGPDYYLPSDAYLETCAAIGAAFFSWRMHELTHEGKYFDELERVLYNSLLTAVALKGDNYTYQNPLNAVGHNRWEWHSCPCCPPMFLKITSEIPEYIYTADPYGVYVNLFIGNDARMKINGTEVRMVQHTSYPWNGTVDIDVIPERSSRFFVKVRIPGWARGEENPYGLYTSDLTVRPVLSVNGKPVSCQVTDGYATVERKWKAGDRISLSLPVAPRVIEADPAVRELEGQVCVASGPVVYAFESVDNIGLDTLKVDPKSSMKLNPSSGLLGGVNTISVAGTEMGGSALAIPYYAIANRRRDTAHKVWMPAAVPAVARIDASKVVGKIPPLIYGSGMEDVNHEIYGGLYDQRIFGESFEEPSYPLIRDFVAFDAPWTVVSGKEVRSGIPHSKLLLQTVERDCGAVEVELRQTAGGAISGLIMNVVGAADGADNFCGYEISLDASRKELVLGKHDHDWQPKKRVPVRYDASEWNRLKVDYDGASFVVSLNGAEVCRWADDRYPFRHGKIGLRTYNGETLFRNLRVYGVDVSFDSVPGEVSGMWSAVGDAMFSREEGAFHGQFCQRVSGRRGSGVSNSGLNRWGIGIRRGEPMTGYVYLKGDVPAAFVALQSAGGEKEYARMRLTGIGKGWRKFAFELVPDADDNEARFVVGLDGDGALCVDMAMLHTGSYPFRKDISDAFAGENLTFLRYGGTMINAPEYKVGNMDGEADCRPPYRGHWYRYSTNGFGIREFVAFARKINAEPAFSVNIEDNPADVLKLLGEKELAGLKYLEIGNEENLTDDSREAYEHYVERFNAFYDVIHPAYPDLVLINAAWWRADKPELMEYVFRSLDGKSGLWDYHPWTDDVAGASMVENELRNMRNLFMQWNPSTRMRVAILEENGNSHGMRRALAHAIVLNAVRRMNGFVELDSPANALQPYCQNDNGWNQGQIFFNSSATWCQPPYYSQQMAAEHHEPLLLESSCLHPMIDLTATTDEAHRRIVLHVVNSAPTSQVLDLQLESAGHSEIARVLTLSGAPDDVNTPEQPRRIFPQELQCVGSRVTLPPTSYTIVVLCM